MDLLLDTQIIAWMASGSPRLSRTAEEALKRRDAILLVSAVTAWEFEDLNRRRRFGQTLPFAEVRADFNMTVLDYPAACWTLLPDLPDLHRDPIDRMLIAHALHARLTLVTADATMRRYPVASLW